MPKYVPEPTPVSDDLHELQRYIDIELRRISDAVNVKVDGAYGGLFQVPGTIVLSPLSPVPVLFDAFDTVVPERPDGVVGDPSLASLVVLTPGSYFITFTTTVINIDPNEEWGFLLAINGISSGLGAAVEPSNQTETVTVSFQVIFTAAKGDIFTMLINSDTSSDCDVVGSEFMLQRVSEEF